MESAINTEGRLSRLEGRVDEALSHMATKADSAELKADIAELRGTLRILIALNIGIALAILSMLVGWLPAGAA
ncbi:MAG: hypothetical protein OXN94_07735 [Chloroflexota bacterium]|nr:hypothetical protein [Chloroflexota bacterium]MDE2952578.1 hypothetical protein [Chloroflexota bacterium]